MKNSIEKQQSRNLLSPKEVTAFQQLVLTFYREKGKHYPWRETRDPYTILVSECMLQQTQADRVTEKFTKFMEAFPTLTALAEAEKADVIARWKGLGYNRRALYLQRAATEILSHHGGSVPDDPAILRTLPGIGRYTSRSIPVFAFDRPEVLIETNIRSVYIHHFFTDSDQVSDAEIEPLVERTLYREEAHAWYSALMDYGSYLKKEHKKITARSSAYKKQSPFKGSDRQVRGRILEILLEKGSCPAEKLVEKTGAERERLLRILSDMEKEGFLHRNGDGYGM